MCSKPSIYVLVFMSYRVIHFWLYLNPVKCTQSQRTSYKKYLLSKGARNPLSLGCISYSARRLLQPYRE